MAEEDAGETFRNVIIPMIRRTLPSMIANDIVGVQPMTGPTGMIFSMRSRYGTGHTAHKAWSFDDWLAGNSFPDTTDSVRIYIDQLLED